MIVISYVDLNFCLSRFILIRQLRQKASKANSSYTADNKKKEQVQNELTKVECELQKIDIDENEMNRLDQQIRHLEHEGNVIK